MSDISSPSRSRVSQWGWLGVALAVPIGACSLLLNSCVSAVEVARTVSPNGRLVATVTEINGGATTDFACRIDITRNRLLRWKVTVGSFYGAVRSACAYGVNVRWLSDDALLLSYRSSRTVSVDPTAIFGDHIVRIVTRSGVDDPQAPCGGMEYGQRHHPPNGA